MSDQAPPPPLDESTIFRAIEPLLADPSSADGELALRAAMRMTIPEAAAAVAACAGHPSPKVRMLVAQWRARRGEDFGSLDEAGRALRAGDAPDDALSAVQAWCAGADPSLKDRAAALAAAFVRDRLRDDDEAGAHRVWCALRALEDAGSAEESAALEEVLASAPERWLRGVALRRLGALEGARGVARTLRALADPDLRGSAARALAESLSAPDRGVAAAIMAAIASEARPDVLASLVDAALAAGVPRRELDAPIARLEPWDAERLSAQEPKRDSSARSGS